MTSQEGETNATSSNYDTVKQTTAAPPPTLDQHALLEEAKSILVDSAFVLQGAASELQRAKEVASLGGFKVDSYIIERPNAVATAAAAVDGDASNPGAVVQTTTGGFSNTDHLISKIDDARADRIAELKRNLLRRHRKMQPENRRDERWDKPKVQGERRRKIVLEKDQDDSPPEPPHTGWSIFVGQMTTKFRHDEPDRHHDQSKVLSRIATIWKSALTDEERKYYNTFAEEARKEYQTQVIEYRATGSYQSSECFRPLEDTNIWVRTDIPCRLEKEIQSYDTVRFRPRPPELDEAYEERQIISMVKRKLRLKGLVDKAGNIKQGVNFPKLLEEERRRRKHRLMEKQQQKELEQSSNKKRRTSASSSKDGKFAARGAAKVVYEILKAPPPSSAKSDANSDYEADSMSEGENDESVPLEPIQNATAAGTPLQMTSPGMMFSSLMTEKRVKITAPQTLADLKRDPTLRPPKEIYRGRPKTIPKRVGLASWPEGWVQVTTERRDGHKDSRWISPGQKTLFTRAEVTKYLDCLKQTDGNEEKAQDLYRVWKAGKRRGQDISFDNRDTNEATNQLRIRTSKESVALYEIVATNPDAKSKDNAIPGSGPNTKPNPAPIPETTADAPGLSPTKLVQAESPRRDIQRKSSGERSTIETWSFIEIYRGLPQDDPGCVDKSVWPDGWLQVKKKRRCGGHDSYWYSPGGNMFRSRVEVKRFFKALGQTNGDEEEAYNIFRSIAL